MFQRTKVFSSAHGVTVRELKTADPLPLSSTLKASHEPITPLTEGHAEIDLSKPGDVELCGETTDSAAASTIVISCIDCRFRDELSEVVRSITITEDGKTRKLVDDHDDLVLPGGSLCVCGPKIYTDPALSRNDKVIHEVEKEGWITDGDFQAMMLRWRDSAADVIRFAVHHHHVKNVIIFDHEGCGAFGAAFGTLEEGPQKELHKLMLARAAETIAHFPRHSVPATAPGLAKLSVEAVPASHLRIVCYYMHLIKDKADATEGGAAPDTCTSKPEDAGAPETGEPKAPNKEAKRGTMLVEYMGEVPADGTKTFVPVGVNTATSKKTRV